MSHELVIDVTNRNVHVSLLLINVTM